MDKYWEEKYKQIGLLWQFEPADSAIKACDLFAENKFQKILIPGVGYGRNARLFVESGFDVTGIEISETAIQLARDNGLDFQVHHGSVNQMPFDDNKYDGIYCYALIHLLNKKERLQFLKNCYYQLRKGGIMVFAMVSRNYKLYGNGKTISKDRFKIDNGLTVFFYDSATIEKEFGQFDLTEYFELDEPVKHMNNEEPMKFFQVVCRKT